MVEALLLSCLQAQIIINRINIAPNLSPQNKSELIVEVKQFSRKECKFNDRKAEVSDQPTDGRSAYNTLWY